ncbi:carbohydrate sulfotransferase 11-like [Babylonia areolata]|uniref:carbohydrate sulfotransferase 11-like n=1 Tax=Babylonia areolata TaxID=304850 RepID=UPI003FD47ACD
MTSRGSSEDKEVEVFSYRRGKTLMMFCNVHKAASTFWLRLFRFLHRDPPSPPASSLDGISKYRVHLTPFNQSRPLPLARVTRMLRPGEEAFRFMFTRDPYSRLWSVYIDKFVLPDFFFWSQLGSVIKDERRWKGTNPKEKRHPFDVCSDVSFREFVEYAVHDPSFPESHVDDHILPVSQTCDPCSFQPHFIGRLEDMPETSKAVLGRLNLTSLTKDHTFQEHVLSQIRTVAEFVYETVIDRRHLRHCVSDEDMQDRLLRAFVLSGYLPPEVLAGQSPPVVSSLSCLLHRMEKLFLAFNRTTDEVKRQRQLYLTKAYRSLPRHLLLKIRDYYKADFDSFGYNPEPPELFNDL